MAVGSIDWKTAELKKTNINNSYPIGVKQGCPQCEGKWMINTFRDNYTGVINNAIDTKQDITAYRCDNCHLCIKVSTGHICSKCWEQVDNEDEWSCEGCFRVWKECNDCTTESKHIWATLTSWETNGIVMSAPIDPEIVWVIDDGIRVINENIIFNWYCEKCKKNFSNKIQRR